MHSKLENDYMSNKLIKVGISQGNINGIGYELILKTFEDARITESCIPVIYGSSKVLAYHRKALELPPININTINHPDEAGANRVNMINCINEDIMVELSRSTSEAEESAQKSLEKAVEDLKSGFIDVLLTAPSFQEQTQYIESQVEPEKKALRMLVKDGLRIALATGKVPLSDVSSLLTVDLLTEKIKDLRDSLVQDFMITTPRIAVLSLNPGMGVSNEMGTEEKEIIVPALKAATDAGVFCFGPYAADEFFGSGEYVKFDGILAMYYDQGLIPFRALTAGEGVCYTAGLPIVRTAPDQGVSYENAGKNITSEASFRNALYLAIDVFKNRVIDRKINANPLKKQYFERGSDNEKLDLTKDEG